MGQYDEVPRDILAAISQEFVGKPTLSYLEDFTGTTLAPEVDLLGLGPLQIGDSRNLPVPSVPVAGSTPVLVNNALELELTGPPPGSLISIGVVGLPFPKGMEVFTLRAVFAAPSGPRTAGDTWALGLFARDGALDDVAAPATRIVMSFKVVGPIAQLTTTGAVMSSAPKTFSSSAYDALFNLPPGSAEPEVTLELFVDRRAAKCRATVYVPNEIVEAEFSHPVLLSGGSLSAVSAGLVLSKGTGTVRAKLRRFEIYEIRSKSFIQERAEDLLALARERLVNWAFLGLPRR